MSKNTKKSKPAPAPAPAPAIEPAPVPVPAAKPAKGKGGKGKAPKTHPAPVALEAATPEATFNEVLEQVIETAPAVTATPEAEPAAAEPVTPKPAKAKTKAKLPAGTGGKPLGCLDAAAIVLSQSPVPMNCKVLTADVLTRGLWTTLGRTPEATMYAAIIREIASKGETSRFIKTDRGLFAISPLIATTSTPAPAAT